MRNCVFFHDLINIRRQKKGSLIHICSWCNISENRNSFCNVTINRFWVAQWQSSRHYCATPPGPLVLSRALGNVCVSHVLPVSACSVQDPQFHPTFQKHASRYTVLAMPEFPYAFMYVCVQLLINLKSLWNYCRIGENKRLQDMLLRKNNIRMLLCHYTLKCFIPHTETHYIIDSRVARSILIFTPKF